MQATLSSGEPLPPLVLRHLLRLSSGLGCPTAHTAGGKGVWRVSWGQEPSGGPQPCPPWGSHSLGGGRRVSPPSWGPGSHKGLKGEKTQGRDDNREQFSWAAAQRPGALVLLRQRGRGRTPKARQSANQRPHGLHQLQPGSWPATHWSPPLCTLSLMVPFQGSALQMLHL